MFVFHAFDHYKGIASVFTAMYNLKLIILLDLAIMPKCQIKALNVQ